ncbi:MAG: DNA repair protein RecO [Candidatus Saccharimonadales bacterium]
MNQRVTTGIILSRTDYGEADRIITLLTPDLGKLTVLAKGVKRLKSKMAGGIELFSVSQITYIQGRGEIGTLISTRLLKHYGHIINDLDRTMLGYDLIKQLNKTTEEEPEAEYFHLLEQAFTALDEPKIDIDLVRVWFAAQLLRLSGHTPNLQTSTGGQKLDPKQTYEFSFEDFAFTPQPEGHFGADDIKFLRLLLSGNQPHVLAKVSGSAARVAAIRQLVLLMQQQYIH